jgi:thiol-disulfide isomerase/thioredoxin
VKPAAQVGAAVGAIVLAFIAGAFLYQRFGNAPPPAAAPGTEPQIPVPAAPKRTVPASVPDFTLEDVDGKPRSIREWAGRPLIINFWATWCAPCRKEIPLLERLRRERRAQRLEIVGVAVDTLKDVRAFLGATPIGYPVLVGEEGGLSVAASLGIDNLALPFTVFADHEGRILVLRLGELHEDQAKLILDTLRDVDSGVLSLAEGKTRVAAGLRNPLSG